MSKRYSTITAERIAEEISYNPDTGELRTLRARKGLLPGDVMPSGVYVIDLCGISTTTSRVAWLLATGAWPTGRVNKTNPDGGLELSNLADYGVVKPMKQRLPELTAARLRELLVYTPETGIFSWRRACSNIPAGSQAGCASAGDGYIRIRLDGSLHLGHRLAWLHVNGEWPLDHIDHINGIRADNRIANLRNATRAENMQNSRRAWSHGSSGLLGAHWDERRGCWTSTIVTGGSRERLGEFSSAEDAHAAYVARKRQVHQFCTI